MDLLYKVATFWPSLARKNAGRTFNTTNSNSTEGAFLLWPNLAFSGRLDTNTRHATDTAHICVKYVNVQTVLTVIAVRCSNKIPKCCTLVDWICEWYRQQCWRKISSSVGLQNRTFYLPMGRGARAQRTRTDTH